MGFDVWKLGVQAKIADIKGKHREKQCKNIFVKQSKKLLQV